MSSNGSMSMIEQLLSDPSMGLVKERREPQVTMAKAVEEVVNNGGMYFCEAPVGVGKSYGYLLPSILSRGKRVVIATGKKALQDQLVNKDVPAIRRVLLGDDKTFTHVAVKGKGNYSCSRVALKVLEREREAPHEYETFLDQSPYGDRADWRGSPPRWWYQATAEDCVHKKCDRYEECGYIRLRADAVKARVVVINHHVLGAEMFFGHGKLVGGPYDVLIVDEAHALDDGIRAAFTARVARDSLSHVRDLVTRAGHLISPLDEMIKPWAEMFRGTLSESEMERTITPPFFKASLADAVLELSATAMEKIGKVEDIYNEGNESSTDEVEGIGEITATVTRRDDDVSSVLLKQAKRKLDAINRALAAAQGRAGEGNTVVFIRKDEHGKLGVDCAPISVAGIAKNYLSTVKSVVLCSATLANDGTFNHVRTVTGVPATREDILPTVFNYPKQGFAYIPKDLPGLTRNHPDYADVMRDRVARAVRLVELSDGGAFILTTANDELKMFAEAMKAKFKGRAFAQGRDWDGDPNAALAKFMSVPNSVLIGSKSFWEGVDVPGGALRLVVITKLPFPRVGDPIVEARKERAGDRGFVEVYVSDMLTELRQGVGRLIRTKDDRGGVAILDSRVWTKPYGGSVMRALPWKGNQVTPDLGVCEKNLPLVAAYYRRGKQ
jgi:ATP-dependent DNA helicase DinG